MLIRQLAQELLSVQKFFIKCLGNVYKMTDPPNSLLKQLQNCYTVADSVWKEAW